MALRASRAGLKDLSARLKSEDTKAFYEALFNTLQCYLGYRLHIPPAGLTANAAIDGLVAREIEPAVASKVKKLFDACDLTRFGYLRVDGRKMRDDKRLLEDVIKYLERKKF